MRDIPVYARSVAYQALSEVAPNELPLFDEVWDDFKEMPTGDGRLKEGQHAFGGEALVLLWAPVIIPVVIAITTHAINRSVDAILEYIKERRQQKDDQDLRALADLLLRELEKNERTQPGE
jgi:hypothetical protein